MTATHPAPQWWSATTTWRLLQCRASASPVLEPKVAPQVAAGNAGTLAHLALQAWAEAGEWKLHDPGTGLQERFDEAAASAGITLGALPQAVITRARLKARGSDLASLLAEADGRIRCEQLLTDEAAHLFGILDICVEGRNGLILDLKTGRNASAVPSPLILHQMTFYAHLFVATYGALPARTVVFSLQRGLIEIPVRARDVATLLSAVQKARQELNLPAVPAPEVCRFCTKRMICEPHWNALAAWPDADAIEGVVGKIERSTSGTIALLIAGKWLTGLAAKKLPADLQPGMLARAVRIRRHPDTTCEEWAATRLTEVQIARA